MTEQPRNVEEVRSRLAAALPALRRRYAIRSLGVFGSWARGEQTPESDVDLLVEFEGVVTYFDILALEDELQALLGVRIDLATPGALKRFIGEQIRSELLPV